jgi:hypothetical protein
MMDSKKPETDADCQEALDQALPASTLATP